jgi:methyl-accepting chemotaxis protein
MAAGLPQELVADFAAHRGDFTAFSAFITDFAKAAAVDRTRSGPGSTRSRAQPRHRRRLGALDDQVTPRSSARSSAGPDSCATPACSCWAWPWPADSCWSRSPCRWRGPSWPVRRLGEVIEALARGDLTRAATSRPGRAGPDGGQPGRRTRFDPPVVRTIGANADALAGFGHQLSSSPAGSPSAAHDTDAQSSSASAEAEEISRNVQTVAAGSEEMGLSIREISNNTTEAAQIAAVAVNEAARATETGPAARRVVVEIGNVIKLITSIAEQTNSAG